jgi:hypothetical protein
MIFPCRHHFQADNKQTYSHYSKLPDGRSGEIRLSGISQVSGSVPRSGITTPPFSGGERAVAGQGITQYIEEKAADGVAHVVFSCRCAL